LSRGLSGGEIFGISQYADAVMRDGKHKRGYGFSCAWRCFFYCDEIFIQNFFPSGVAFLGLSTLSISAGEHNFWQHSPCVRGGIHLEKITNCLSKWHLALGWMASPGAQTVGRD